MPQVTIGGKTIEVPDGSSIRIIGDSLLVNGIPVDVGDALKGVTKIELQGDLLSLKCDKSVTCGTVHGDVHAQGSVNCDDVGGNVTAGGSVNCDDVGGNITAGGSVRRG